MASTSTPKIVSANRQRQLELNLRGLRLEREALDRLRNARIYAQTGVSLEHQAVAKRHVLRGVESGGATSALGHFVAFVKPSGEPLTWLTPIDAIAPNGLHAVVIAPELMRFEMFRFERSYRLSISRHAIEDIPGQRPRLVSRRLLLSLEGYLSIDLTSKENRVVAGHITPEFFVRSGEELSLSDPLLGCIKTLTAAVTCIDCRHTHFAVAPGVVAATPTDSSLAGVCGCIERGGGRVKHETPLLLLPTHVYRRRKHVGRLHCEWSARRATAPGTRLVARFRGGTCLGRSVLFHARRPPACNRCHCWPLSSPASAPFSIPLHNSERLPR